MLTPPAGLPEDLLVSVLGRGWRLTETSVAFRPVGWGSHHGDITDVTRRWNVPARAGRGAFVAGCICD